MAASEGSSHNYEISSMVRGYHQYRSIWNAIDGEELPYRVELSNPHDLFAVAVNCRRTRTKKISSICSSFLRRGGTVLCKVTGSRRYSADLPQGGLEIPCKFIFTGISKDIEKVKKLIKFATRDGKLSIITTESPSSSITVAESSGTTVDIAQSPSTSITVAESSSTTVDIAQSPSTSITVAESSSTTVDIAQSPSTSITVAESSSTTVDSAQSPSTSITVAESSGTTVDIAQSPSTSITVAESSSTTVDVAQSPCALIKVTKSPGTTVKVPSSSTKVTESSVPLITISKPASSFDVVDSSIKIENTQLLGSHCKRLKSQTNQQGKK